ncbi:MAG: aminotransferase class I/II-fold pyridoxal phosphate-dependent enzyme [Luteibaculum sp.]
MTEQNKKHPASAMMSEGHQPEKSLWSIKAPIYQSSTFAFESAEQGAAFFRKAYAGEKFEGDSYIYSRLGHPNLDIAEKRLKLWDNTEDCAIFESGMAAISTTLLYFLRPGDYLVYNKPIYGGTDSFIRRFLEPFGIKAISFYADEDWTSVEKRILEHPHKEKIRLVYIETPANPNNALVDLAACSNLCKALGPELPLLVDNTYMGPLFQQPTLQGADIVLYSATKYIAGHSDLIAGACLGKKQHLEGIKKMRGLLGCTASPQTAWLLSRSLETLEVRMQRQNTTAKKLAAFLQQHPSVQRVSYLGLLQENTREHSIYKQQCTAPGAMISFNLKGNKEKTYQFLNALTLIKLAVSLGSTESLAQHPASMTHSDIPIEDLRRMGIDDNLIRLSVGLEHPEDLIADLDRALTQAL